MLINRKEVKKMIHDKGKQIGPDGISALNSALTVLIYRAIRYAGPCSRIRSAEFNLAIGTKKEEK